MLTAYLASALPTFLNSNDAEAEMTLNSLERAVLHQIGAATPEIAMALNEQLEGVVVSKRENTNAGFFTTLQTRNVKTTIKQARAIGNVFARIEGLQNPMTFVLFIKDGLIDMLEGAAIDENTSEINFSTVRFEVLSAATHG
jgi:hypothetical protein